MKIKLLILFFVGLFAISGYSQTEMISISNLKYTNGSAIASGSPIQIAEGGTVSVTFDLRINNPGFALIKGGTLSVYSKLNSSTNIQHVSILFGQNAISASVSRQCTIELKSSHFPSGTGSIYAQFSPIDNSPILGTTVIVKIVPLITSNYIIGNQTVYEGDSVGSINGPTPNGGNGLYTYAWQQKIGSGGAWTNIPGATGVTFQPTNLSVSTISYRRIVTSLFGTLTDTSNEVTVTILPNTPIENNTITLSGSEIQGSTPTGGIGSFTYSWYAYILEGEGWQWMGYTTKDWSIPDGVYQFMENLGNSEGFIYREVRSGNQISRSNIVTIYPAQPIQNNTITLSGNDIIGSLPTGGTGTFRYEYYSYLELPDGEIEGPSMMPGSEQNYRGPIQSYLTIKYYRRVISGNKSSYSNIITAPIIQSSANKTSFTENIDSDLTVYPNPTSESINFSTTFSTEKDIEIIVYSESLPDTKSVFKGRVTPNQVVNWNIPSNYSKGVYFYKIISDNAEVKTGKFIFR
ncbi:T9SS type A sorting domain-containing protein [Flavobacterium ajazii]|uniref:T9SS type A sorting domain-containing protein n=1 Tax=Flavobacterium ajazii TaxID=2692318 RepID=UPI0013D80E70|nr:T9SS type A sorting domain-containing protein [Flavobacterium ajazii]